MVSVATRRRRFVEHVRRECRLNKVRFILSPAKELSSDDGGCGGYFGHEPRVLAVACGRRRWFETLVHEYCHMRQFLTGARAWVDCTDRTDGDFSDWTVGRRVPSRRRVDRACRLVQSCELDAERRTWRMLRAYRLLDASGLRRYARESNAYVLLYELLRHTGTWYGRRLVEVPGLYRSMPSEFQRRSWYNRLPDGYAYRLFKWSLRPGQRRRAMDRMTRDLR